MILNKLLHVSVSWFSIHDKGMTAIFPFSFSVLPLFSFERDLLAEDLFCMCQVL